MAFIFLSVNMAKYINRFFFFLSIKLSYVAWGILVPNQRLNSEKVLSSNHWITKELTIFLVS